MSLDEGSSSSENMKKKKKKKWEDFYVQVLYFCSRSRMWHPQPLCLESAMKAALKPFEAKDLDFEKLATDSMALHAKVGLVAVVVAGIVC